MQKDKSEQIHASIPNSHILENIDFYLKKNDPDYAFLITGDWGAGKTHFLDDLIESHTKADENIKIIKVSLFGVKNTSEIDVKIFQALHPFLGSRPMRLAGTVLKGAIKFGAKIDIDEIETSSELDPSKLKLSDFFSKNKKKQEIVVAFDDLERSSTELKELLGYINQLVETSKIRTILVANEKFILENDTENTYKDFKEKVIGKTFEIQQDHEKIIDSFLSETKNKNLINNKEKIKHIHRSSKYKNLRNLKQSIIDFQYLTSRIERDHLENEDFFETLLCIFFPLSIEVKKGNLTEQELRSGLPFSPNATPGSPSYEIYKKYFKSLKKDTYRAELWADILFSSELSKINSETEKLAFFITPQKEQKPNWIKLWNHLELEDKEFEELLLELNEDIQKKITDTAPIYLHKVSLAIYFSKKSYLPIKTGDLKQKIEKNIKDGKLPTNWANQKLEPDSDYNGTGFFYFDKDDKDFKEIKKLVIEKTDELYTKNQLEENRKYREDLAKKFFESIEYGEIDTISETLLRHYETTPFLINISHRIFARTLSKSKNSNIQKIASILGQRYTESKLFNGHVQHHYLAPELKFWRDTKKEIDKIINETDRLKKLVLENFKKHTIEKIIEKLSKHSQN